jgi:dTDP-glucose 4,6-dehydratase
MKLLITGGHGFIGSHFMRRWRDRHPADELVNVDALTYAASADRVADLEGRPGYRAVRADVCDRAALAQAIAGCEAVVHFAAETHVDRSITDAAPFLRTNVDGTYAVAQAARAAGVTRLLHVSTDEVYGPILSGAVEESAPLAPHSPYAASKAAGDLLVQAAHRTHGLPVVIARPTNVYGPWQLPEKFIPVCIAAALEGRPIPLYGDGQQRRNWLHVEDLCRALALILEQGQVGSVYNVGSGHEQPNRRTAEQVLGLLGRPASVIQHVADRPGHDRRYAMRDERVRALGWRATTAFAEGLAGTVAWYRAHEAWWRPLTQRLRDDPYHWLHRPAGAGAGSSARAAG